jgi:hypothetical protein
VLVLISPDALNSQICLREVEWAVEAGKVIVPMLIKAVDITRISEHLAGRNFIFMRGEAEFERGISALLEVLATDLPWVREHTRINELAMAWDTRGRPSALLLRGGALVVAEKWATDRPASAPGLMRLQSAFIIASRRAETRRNQLTGSLAAGVLITLALASLAFWQREAAVIQTKIALEQQQEALVQRDRASQANERVQQLELALRSVDPDNPVLRR